MVIGMGLKKYMLLMIFVVFPLQADAILQSENISLDISLDKNFVNGMEYNCNETAYVSISVKNPSDYALTENCFRVKVLRDVPVCGKMVIPSLVQRHSIIKEFYRCDINGIKQNSNKTFNFSFQIDLPHGNYGLLVELLTRGQWFVTSGGDGFSVGDCGQEKYSRLDFLDTEFTVEKAAWVKYARHVHINEPYRITGKVNNTGGNRLTFDVVYRLYRFDALLSKNDGLIREKRYPVDLYPSEVGVYEFEDVAGEEEHYKAIITAEADGRVLSVNRDVMIFTADRWAEIYELYANNYIFSEDDGVEITYIMAGSGGRNDDVVDISPQEAAKRGLTEPVDVLVHATVEDKKGVVYDNSSAGMFLAQMDYVIPGAINFKAPREVRDFNITLSVYDNDTGELLAAQTITYLFDDFVKPWKDPCFDGVGGQDETDMDCGGLVCSKCRNEMKCIADSDCISGHCYGDVCKTRSGIDMSLILSAALLAVLIIVIIYMKKRKGKEK